MNVSDIASTASSMSMAQTQDAVGVTVLKKSMDIDKASAQAMIQSVSAPSGSGTYPLANLGQTINTTA